MRSYRQYCPISRSSEILGERWTLLVIRNLMLGCTGFDEIAGGVPGMSRSLLSQRLRALEDVGVVRSEPKPTGRGREYHLTEAGLALHGAIAELAAWGTKWIERQPQDSDPSFALWAWVHSHLCRERLPSSRVVVEFSFPEQPREFRRFWIIFEPEGAELCQARPKYDVDLWVEARSEAFTRWHLGELSWGRALRGGGIKVRGPAALRRALPTWNERVE